MKHDLSKNVRFINVCVDFETLQFKVPINFLGTVGFSLRRDGRFSS